ncbi:MAG: hypothetical protein NT154_35820, partial [Verrucomicrobia bacterium]|nr:hypothetical protein [Verrucomicrobiota bacterium]
LTSQRSPCQWPRSTPYSSVFARTSGFANYKLSAFANYSRPLLLAPRHKSFQAAQPADGGRNV